METARTIRWALAAVAAPVLLAACSEVPTKSSTTTSAAGTSSKGPEARASLVTADGARAATVTFTAVDGGTEVEVKVTATKAVVAGRFHGLHVHANDDPANGEGCKADPAMLPATWFTAVDGHLKEGSAAHSEHKGDLPSLLVAKDGTASLRFTTDRFTPGEVVGKAVVVHAGADNFANIPIGSLPDQYTANAEAASAKTAATGNAGDRMACGVITRA